MKHSFAIFSCVGTPDNPDGSSNLDYVFSAAKQASEQMQPGAIFIQKSTVPVGTGLKITKLFNKLGSQASYVSNPEFLRESTAVSDTLYFDRVVAGGDNNEAVKEVVNIYRKLEKARDSIAKIAGISEGSKLGQYITTSLNSAELIKVASNAFLAMKISFANSMAKLSDVVGADIVEVMDAVGADPRIGRSFLNAGRGYGGGCFPKDVSGLIASGLQNGVDLELIRATQLLNESMPGYVIEKMRIALGSKIAGKKIAVLGLSYKAGTSDVRKSPGIAIANILAKSEAEVTTYDPKANKEASKTLQGEISQEDSIDNAIKNVDVIIITTDWPEITSYPTSKYANAMNGTTFIDAVNGFDRDKIKAVGLDYIGVGR